jgi:hypothetical protein
MWGTALALSMFLLGFLCSTASSNSYIKAKADPKWRTAMCVDGKFYYVVPEREYVELEMARNSIKVYNKDDRTISYGVSEGHRAAAREIEP